MRQLTSLDAQFLALESARQTGHVGGLAILDPSTAPGGTIDGADIQRLLEERLPALPPFRWKLAEVPLGIDFPYWVDDPDFDLNFHVREIALPPPGSDDQLSEQVSRIMARPLDRSRPLWELYLIHGVAKGYVGRAHEDPPRGDRRHVRRRDHGTAARPDPRGPPAARSGAGARRRGAAGAARDARAAGCSACRATRVRLLRSLPSTIPNVDEVPAIFGGIPGANTVGRLASRGAGRAHRRRLARAQHPSGAEDEVQRPHLPAPAVRVRPGLARGGEGRSRRRAA